MKKIFFLILLSTIHSISQNLNEGEITYKVVCNTCDNTKEKKSEIEKIDDLIFKDLEQVNFILIFKDKESFFELQDKVYSDNSTINKSIIKGLISGGDYYLDLNKDIQIQEKTLMGQRFLIKTNPSLVQWKITTEQKEIDGYLCFKAIKNEKIINSVGTFENEIVAWFTPALPFQFGPKNHNSLPGLILVLHDKKFSFYLDNIDLNPKVSDLSKIKKPNGKLITEEEFKKVISNATENFRN
jgi:GLPGLI family protein